jgi:hypothetical protein
MLKKYSRFWSWLKMFWSIFKDLFGTNGKLNIKSCGFGEVST